MRIAITVFNAMKRDYERIHRRICNFLIFAQFVDTLMEICNLCSPSKSVRGSAAHMKKNPNVNSGRCKLSTHSFNIKSASGKFSRLAVMLWHVFSARKKKHSNKST